MGENKFVDIYGDFTLFASDNTGYGLVFYGGTISVVNAFGSVLAEFEADDISSVVVKMVHGRWIDKYNDCYCAECSECGEFYETADQDCVTADSFRLFKHFYKFCPNCGAMMDLPDIHVIDTADHCVCCGEIIPEGRQIYPKCENSADF